MFAPLLLQLRSQCSSTNRPFGAGMETWIPLQVFLFFLNETETDLHIFSYLTIALDMQIILVSFIFILRQSVSFLIQFRHRHNKTDKILCE